MNQLQPRLELTIQNTCVWTKSRYPPPLIEQTPQSQKLLFYDKTYQDLEKNKRSRKKPSKWKPFFLKSQRIWTRVSEYLSIWVSDSKGVTRISYFFLQSFPYSLLISLFAYYLHRCANVYRGLVVGKKKENSENHMKSKRTKPQV